MDSSAAATSSDPLFNVDDIERQIGGAGLDALWQEVREQWALDMFNMVTEQEMIRQENHRNPGRINRKLDCYPDMYTHPLFDNFVQVSYGWPPNWAKDPDKVRYIKRKFPVVVAECEKPMDRAGWTRGMENLPQRSPERPVKGSTGGTEGRGVLVDRWGDAL